MASVRWSKEDLDAHNARQDRLRCGVKAIAVARQFSTDLYEFQLEPVSKPRQTQQDKWKQRPAVMAYRAFADALRAQAGALGFVLPVSGWSIAFYLPMPASWSKRKRAALDGQPHQQKPDCDNLLKAVMDALLEDDSVVWSIAGIEKRWAQEGRIVVRINQ